MTPIRNGNTNTTTNTFNSSFFHRVQRQEKEEKIVVEEEDESSGVLELENSHDFDFSLSTSSSSKMDAKTAVKKRASKSKKGAKAEQLPLVALNFVKVPEKIDTTVRFYISYAGPNRPLVREIANVLKQQNNFEIWADYERTPNGWIFETCMKAIDKSNIFLLFLSEPYKNSDSCRSEASHALRKKKDILVVKLQHPCEPDGWLVPVCASRLYANFILRYRSFGHAIDELLRQVNVLAEKVKPGSRSEPLMTRSKSAEKLQEPNGKTFDETVVQCAVERMQLRRFDALKLVMTLRTFNAVVFDLDFIEAIHRAEMHHNNGGIYELCKRLRRTEGKAFVLTARAARVTGGMTSLAEAIEDTVIELCGIAKDADIAQAAALQTQLFDGFDALNLHRRKSHVIDQIKRTNLELYQALVDIEDGKRKEKIQRLHNVGKRLRRFGKFPMPDRDDGVCIKAKNEDTVRNAIRVLCQETEEDDDGSRQTKVKLNKDGLSYSPRGLGILAIIGDKGLGKSPLVSKLLFDDEFLLKECRVDVVAWMNAYELSSSGCFIDERRFYLQLAEAIGLTINLNLEITVERQLERYLSQRERATLVVLENVYSSHIISLTANFDCYLRVIAISPNRECIQAACSRYRSQIITFDKVPQLKIESFLVEKLPPTIDKLKIISLAILCDGFPLVAKMLASQFASGNEAKEAESKYRLLVESSPEKQLISISPRQDGGDKIRTTIANIFHLNFERESRELFRRYSALLWFGVDEIVEVNDIALLWGCHPEEVAPFCEEHFVSKSLLQSVEVYEAVSNNATDKVESSKRQCFKMHSLLHHVVLEFARKKERARKRYSLAAMTLQAGRTYPERREGENILHLAVRLHKRVIFSAVVNFIGEAESLLALCQEKEATNDQTPLDYLCAEDWKDERELHLFKDTALGLLCLLYERLATSKIRPGMGVEEMTKSLQIALAGLLAKVLTKIEDKDETLLMAARENFGSLALALLARGAYPNTRDREDGSTALTLFSRHGNEVLVRTLLYGQQQLGWIGLSLVKAVAAGRESLVRLLLDRGASPDSCDDDGESGVIKAVKTQNREILSLLLENGADPNVIERNIHTERFNPSKNVTALMLAVELGNEDLVNLLLHHFADPAAKNSFGETALMLATKRNQKNIIETLRHRTKLIKI